MPPSTVWRKITKLQSLKEIVLKKDSHYSIISFIKWISYQGKEENPDRHRTGTGQAPDTNKNGEECKEENPSDISSLKTRYDQDLLNRVCDALRSTRKSGKIADSVLLVQLQKWEKYTVDQVEVAFRVYLEKEYARQGKREDYLLGIIRNIRSINQETPVSTGSTLLDSYYANVGS